MRDRTCRENRTFCSTQTLRVNQFATVLKTGGPGGLSAFGFNMAALDYGCHCSAIINGQYHGHGQAVDPLDAVCKEYLGCIRCVKKQTQCEKIDVSDRVFRD